MERVTLPKVVHKVELEEEPEIVRRASVPAGESLPTWEHIPLDAKFPMIPAPRGSVVLATTDLCQTKHCATRDHDFDLTDPYAYIMSNDYSALHDPHLKAHFSSFYMRKHLIQNGFITPEGQVVCTLKEFNEYRRYLRKLCLLELARERKRQEEGESKPVDEKAEEKEKLAIVDLRARILQQEEKQRQKFMAQQAEAERRMLKRQQELEEKQLEREQKRRQNDNRRRQIIAEIRKSERIRSCRLLQKWDQAERKRQERIEHMRKQNVLNHQKKVISKWNARRRYQENRLAVEAELREEIDREKQQKVENRKLRMQKQWRKQEVALKSLRNQSARKRKALNEKFEKRMLALMRGGSGRSRSRVSKSPYQSIWVVEKVLRKLSFPDIYYRADTGDQKRSDTLMDVLNSVIGQAVDMLNAEYETECDMQMLKDGAQAVVQMALEGIIQESHPKGEKGEDERQPSLKDLHTIADEDLLDIAGFIPSKADTEEKVEPEEDLLPVPTEESPISDEELPVPAPSLVRLQSGSIPLYRETTDELGVEELSINVLRHSMMRLDKEITDEEKIETETAISSLNILLDDILDDKCSRHELEKIVEYAAPCTKVYQGLKEPSTSTVVEIMLKAILSDLKTEKVTNEALTLLILSLIDGHSEIPDMKLELLEDFLVAVLQNITEQLQHDNLSKDQLQLLTEVTCTLFREQALQTSSVAVNDVLGRMMLGMKCSPKQQNKHLPICKMMVGKVIRHLASLAFEWCVQESDGTQLAQSVVCESLKILADSMSSCETSSQDAVASAVVAEWIIKQVLKDLVQLGPIRLPRDGDTLRRQTCLLADAIVKDTFNSLRDQMPEESFSTEDNGGPIEVNKLVSDLLKYIINPKAAEKGGVDLNTVVITMGIVGNSLKHFANLISSSSSYSYVVDGAEENYQGVKTMIVDTLNQLACNLNKMIPLNISLNSPSSDKLLAQISREMREYRIVASLAFGNGLLLQHECFAVSLQIFIQTLCQLKSLLSLEEELKVGKDVKATVSISLKQLATSNSYEKVNCNTSSTATRIVNQTLKNLRTTTVQQKKQKAAHTMEDSVNQTVVDVLYGLLGATTSKPFTVFDPESDTSELEYVARDMVSQTIQQLARALLGEESTCQKNTSLNRNRKIVVETMRQLTMALLVSANIVQDNIDLNSSYAASQLVRHSLQHLSEVLVKAVWPKDHNIANSGGEQVITKSVEILAKAISDGTMTIGDKQNLTNPMEATVLVNNIITNLTTSSTTPSSTEESVILKVLERLADGVFNSLGSHSTDTVILANRVINDILNQLAVSVKSHLKSDDIFEDISLPDDPNFRDIAGQLDDCTASWPTVSSLVTIYEFSGCWLIAGDITKALLANLSEAMTVNLSEQPGASCILLTASVVGDMLNKVAFGAILTDDEPNSTLLSSKQTDHEIMNYLVEKIEHTSLSQSDILTLAETILSNYRIRNFPPLGHLNSMILMEFVTDLLTQMCEKIEADGCLPSDLTNIEKSVFPREAGKPASGLDHSGFGIGTNIKGHIDNVLYLAKTRRLKQSQVDNIARHLQRAEENLNKDGEKESRLSDNYSAFQIDKKIREMLYRLRNKLLAGEFTKDEMIDIVASVLRACLGQVAKVDCDSDFPLAKVMNTVRAVTHLNSVICDIADGVFPSDEIWRLAESMKLTIEETQSEIIKSPRDITSFSFSAITEVLQETLLTLKEGDGLDITGRLTTIILEECRNEPLSNIPQDPEEWKMLSDLVENIIRAVSEQLRLQIASLTSSGSIRLVCNDSLRSPSDGYVWKIPSVTLKSIKYEVADILVRALLYATVRQTHISESERVLVGDSKTSASTAAVELVDSTLQRHILDLKHGTLSQTECDALSDVALKAYSLTKGKSLKTEKDLNVISTRSVLVALSKTYTDLADVLIQQNTSAKHNVSSSVRAALIKLIHDIDLHRLSLESIDCVGEVLLKWWNDNKSQYEENFDQEEAKTVMSTLIDNIKSKSKIIGPPRKNELHATVKITEQRIRNFVEDMAQEKPELLIAASRESLSQSSSIADGIVQTVLRVLEDDSWTDTVAGPQDTSEDLVTETVNSLLKHIRSEIILDDMAQEVTSSILQTVQAGRDSEGARSFQNLKNELTLNKINSYLKDPQKDKSALLEVLSTHAARSTTSFDVDQIVRSLVNLLEGESVSSVAIEELMDTFRNTLNVGPVSTSVENQQIDSFVHETLDSVLTGCLWKTDNDVNGQSLTPSLSDLARRAVDSVIQILATSKSLSEYSVTAKDSITIKVTTKNKETRDRDFEISKLHSEQEVNKEKTQEIRPLETTAQETLPREIGAQGLLLADFDENTQDLALLKVESLKAIPSETSAIAAIAVDSLITCLESSEAADLKKIKSFVQKAEERDPGLLKVISDKSMSVSPTDSVIDQMVQMILQNIQNEPDIEAEPVGSLSETSHMAEMVVASLVKLIGKSGTSSSKAASQAVQSLLNAMEKDLQMARQLHLEKSSRGNIAAKDSALEKSKGPLTTLQRMKEILLKIIQDVSESRLTREQVEHIASTAAGEMVKTFAFEPLSSTETPSPASLVVISTLKSIIKDIEEGQLCIEDLVRHKQTPEKEDMDQSHHNASPLPTTEAVPVQQSGPKIGELTEILSAVAKSYSTSHAYTGEAQQSDSFAKCESIDGEKNVRSTEDMSAIIRETLTKVLEDIKLNKLPVDGVSDIATCIADGNLELQKHERFQSWVEEGQFYCEDLNLVRDIAAETVKNVLKNIKEKTIDTSEVSLIWEAMKLRTQSSNGADLNRSSSEIVIKNLENLLDCIQTVGLTTDTTNTIVKTVIDIATQKPRQPGSYDTAPTNKNSMVSFLSKTLGPLLTTIDFIGDIDDQEKCTEKDSFNDVVVANTLQEHSLVHTQQDESEAQDNVNVLPLKGGEILHIDKSVTASALSAISIRSHGTVDPHEPLARNSFRNLHRPDLTRTKDLSHGRMQDVEAKLQWIAEQNTKLVHSKEDADLTIVTDGSPSRTCSSSSASPSIENIDGKLQSIISFCTAEEAVIPVQPDLTKSNDPNINANSPRPPCIKPISKSKRTKSSKKSGKVPVSRLHKIASKCFEPTSADTSCSKASIYIGSVVSNITTNLSRQSPRCIVSQPNLKSPFRYTASPGFAPLTKRKQFASDLTPMVKNEYRRSSSVSLSGSESGRVGKPSSRVQSLCGAHTSKVTVRKVMESTDEI